MPTGKDLRKWAKSTFTPLMAQRGFTLVTGSRFGFVREVSGLYHFITAQHSQWAPQIYVHAFILNTKTVERGYRVGARLGLGEVGPGSTSWPVANETQANESFASLLKAIDEVAMPYFAKISSTAEFNAVDAYIAQRGMAGTARVIDDALREFRRVA